MRRTAENAMSDRSSERRPLRDDLRLYLTDMQDVSAIVDAPPKPTACYVLAHGAGAGMAHPFMTTVSDGLTARGIATLRYQFPFMERGLKRPDAPAIAKATVRAAVAEAARRFPFLPIIAGGKSFGGRMTSQAQAEAAMPHVVALAFLGFPLHARGRPSANRAQHLYHVRVPMLFLQGTRDTLAKLELLEATVTQLGLLGTLVLSESADHAFHVRAKSGRTDSDVLHQVLDAFAKWAGRLIT